MTTQQSPAVPPKKKQLHPDTVLRVAIDWEPGKHVTALVVTTVGGEVNLRLLPRFVKQLAARLNSVADRYAQQKAGAA